MASSALASAAVGARAASSPRASSSASTRRVCVRARSGDVARLGCRALVPSPLRASQISRGRDPRGGSRGSLRVVAAAVPAAAAAASVAADAATAATASAATSAAATVAATGGSFWGYFLSFLFGGVFFSTADGPGSPGQQVLDIISGNNDYGTPTVVDEYDDIIVAGGG